MIFVDIQALLSAKLSKMQDDLKTMGTTELVDLLAYMTAQLTSSIAEKNTGAVQQFEYDISLIQGELHSRLRTKANTNISDTDIEFKSETT